MVGVILSVAMFALFMLGSLLLIGGTYGLWRQAQPTAEQASSVTQEALLFNLGIALFIVLFASGVHAMVVSVALLVRARSIQTGSLLRRAVVAAACTVACYLCVLVWGALQSGQAGNPNGWAVIALLTLAIVLASALPHILAKADAARDT